MLNAFFTKDFQKHLKKFSKRSALLKERVREKMEGLMDDPLRNSEELTGDFKGKRRIYVGKSGFRVIYSVCNECREKNYERFNSCFDCKDRDNNSIVFFDIIRRSQGYRRY